jgi:hypothetical protein
MLMRQFCRTMVLLLLCGASSQADTLSWSFQKTGFEAGMIGDSGSSAPDTALAMRDGTWPIIFAAAPVSNPSSVNALSQFPVTNPATGKPWHQVGTRSAPVPLTQQRYRMRASTSPTGSFGFAIQDVDDTFNRNFAVAGDSLSGLGPVMNGVSAMDFNESGGLVLGDDSTIPTVFGKNIVDIATSASGDVGVLVQNQSTQQDGPVTYWQNSPLLGGWQSTPNPPPTPNPFGSFSSSSLELAFDSAGRPHFAGVVAPGTTTALRAFSWNVISGQWISQDLDISTNGSIDGVALAASDEGMVGAAWVNNGALKYAFRDSTVVSPNWTVTTVTTSLFDPDTQQQFPVHQRQSVGLAFDTNGLPLISFVVGSSPSDTHIWLAYDPPVFVPEPGSLALMVSAAFAFLSLSFRGRCSFGRSDVV